MFKKKILDCSQNQTKILSTIFSKPKSIHGESAAWQARGHAHPLPPLERECFRLNRQIWPKWFLFLYDSYKISLGDVIKVIKGKFSGVFHKKIVNISKKKKRKSTGQLYGLVYVIKKISLHCLLEAESKAQFRKGS